MPPPERRRPLQPAARWIVGFRGGSLPPALGRVIRAGRIDGLMFFRDNTGGSVAGACELRREVLDLVPPGRPFVFAADEEGGLISQVSRLALPDGGAWPSLPTPRALGRVDQPRECRFVGRLLGRRLRALGVTVDFAPSLDLDEEPENPVIGSRSFGPDPARVAVLGLAFAEGLAGAGVAPCFKHYPGHGGTRLDSHRTLPVMDPRERARHESPFRECLQAIRNEEAAWSRRPHPWVMGAHVDWGGGIPASLDRRVLSRVRRWLPGAILVTDSLEMGAVAEATASSALEAASRATAAGNDLLLVARGWESALPAIEAGEQAVLRPPGGARAGRASIELQRRTDRSRRPAGRRTGGVVVREDTARLARLHLASIRFSVDPAALPGGPWLWVVTEGLAPYAWLRDWIPARSRRRPCSEVVWVPEPVTPHFTRALARRLARDERPVLVATLFRGRPVEAARAAWAPLVEHRRTRVVAHLLDERWPDAAGPGQRAEPLNSGPGERAVALTSGPSAESLDALLAALALPDGAWLRGNDGLYFVVDSARGGLAK